MKTEEQLLARIAQLEKELDSCDCTGQVCPNDSINPNCTTHGVLLKDNSSEWFKAQLEDARSAETTKVGKTARCVRDSDWLDAVGDHRDIPEPLTREAIQAVFAKVRGDERIAQLEVALKQTLEWAEATDDDLPVGWQKMRDEARAALDAPTTGKWLEKHDAEVKGKLQSELDQLQLIVKAIDEKEFLRRAMAMETDNRDNLNAMGKMLVGLHKKAETAFQRGHDAALSASTKCTQCDSPGHFRPNDDEAICGECLGDDVKLAELLLQHLAEDGGVLTKAIRPETKVGLRLKEWAMKAAERFKQKNDELKAKYLEAVEVRKAAIKEMEPYGAHLGFCCRGLPSALRPCNCGFFDLIGPLSDREIEKRKKHKNLGPFPNREQIDEWIKRDL